MGYTTQLKTDQDNPSQKLSIAQINQDYLNQLVDKIKSVQPKKPAGITIVFAKKQPDCLNILNLRLNTIFKEAKTDIEKYDSILLALHRCRLALAEENIDPGLESKLKSILIDELNTFVESKFSLSEKEKNDSSAVDEKIQKSLLKISDIAVYGSLKESLFCRTWEVYSPSCEYPFWQEMLVEMSVALNETPPNYNKIPAMISAYFGVYQDSQLITVENGKQEIKIEKLNKEKLAKELEIFTYKNLVKYFTNYLIDYAINENNNDVFIRDKSILIGREVLCPLFEVVSLAKDLLAPNRAPDKIARDGWAEVFVANHKMIEANIDVLRSPHEITEDIKGQITIKPVPEDKAPLITKVSTQGRPSDRLIQQSFQNRLPAFLKHVFNKKNALYISCGVFLGLLAIGIIVATGGAAAPVVIGGGIFAMLGITGGSMAAIIATGATILGLAAAVVGGISGWLCKKAVECISCMKRSALKPSNPIAKLPIFASSREILTRLSNGEPIPVNASQKTGKDISVKPTVKAACLTSGIGCFSRPFTYVAPPDTSIPLKRRQK